ncbi:MAG: aspartate carbamoyltransferase [Cyanobacteria bacterium P01_D01_bin.156]
MKVNNSWRINFQNPLLWGAILAVISFSGIILYRQTLTLHQRQAEVALRGAHVMPFDLEKTTHHFEKMQDGGLQTVVVDNPIEIEQVRLIQSHLQEEAAKFQAGDFSDPAAIHGDTMPGLKTLASGYRDIKIEYTALPNGGQIRYTTQTPGLVSAVHDWFAAQLSDHGHHAQ